MEWMPMMKTAGLSLVYRTSHICLPSYPKWLYNARHTFATMPPLSLSHLYHCCDKTPQRKAILEGRVYFRLQFERDKSPSWWETIAASNRHCGRIKKSRTHILAITLRREHSGSQGRFLNSKPAPSDIFPPSRLHHLNLPKQCHHQLGTTYAIAWDYGGDLSSKAPFPTSLPPALLCSQHWLAHVIDAMGQILCILCIDNLVFKAMITDTDDNCTVIAEVLENLKKYSGFFSVFHRIFFLLELYFL